MKGAVAQLLGRPPFQIKVLVGEFGVWLRDTLDRAHLFVGYHTRRHDAVFPGQQGASGLRQPQRMECLAARSAARGAPPFS